MGRLFAGTQWDRPPRCERCGALEAECTCPPAEPPAPERIDPSRQTARIRVEKRPKGKSVKDDGSIEIQGSHLDRVESLLASIGYKTKRG
jgi:translation initiation factor 1